MWGHRTGHRPATGALKGSEARKRTPSLGFRAVSQESGTLVLSKHLQARCSTSPGPASSHPLSTAAFWKPGNILPIADRATGSEGSGPHSVTQLRARVQLSLSASRCRLTSRSHSRGTEGRTAPGSKEDSHLGGHPEQRLYLRIGASCCESERPQEG